MAHDASPSWSGFNYQGKVALYYALRLINEKAADFDFTDYSLVLENTEDFEVRLKDTPISLHQVKAYQNSSFSSYSKALVGITLELYNEKSAQGYIHTWNPINPKENKTFTESIASDFSDIVNEYRNCQKKEGNTIIEQAASTKGSIKKLAAIIRLALPGTNEKNLVKLLESIGNITEDAVKRIQPYGYPDGKNCCDLDEINNKVKEELSLSFSNRGITNTPQQLKNAFHYLLGYTDKHIIERHKNTGGSPIPISFNEILSILSHDFEDVSSEYLAYEFKNQFLSKFDEFMTYPELYTEPELDNGAVCNLRSIYTLLSNLSAIDLWDYHRNFSPHEYIDTSNNLSIAFNTDLQGVFLVLIKIFNEIDYEKSKHDKTSKKITYSTTLKPTEHYLPTTIQSGFPASIIARKVINNPNMIEALFEISTLIYDGALITKLPSQLGNHTTAPDQVGADMRQRRESILENIRLIPIQMAKDELNAK